MIRSSLVPDSSIPSQQAFLQASVKIGRWVENAAVPLMLRRSLDISQIISAAQSGRVGWGCFPLTFSHPTKPRFSAEVRPMKLGAGCVSPRVGCRSRYQQQPQQLLTPKKTPQHQETEKGNHTRNLGNVFGAPVKNAGSYCRSLSGRNIPRFRVLPRCRCCLRRVLGGHHFLVRAR